MLSGKMQVSSYKVTFIWPPKMERTVWDWVSQAKKSKRTDTAEAVSAKAQSGSMEQPDTTVPDNPWRKDW